MPNLLQRSATWLAEKLQSAAGRSITYRRGSQVATLTATPQKQDYEVTDDDGIPRREVYYDWTFAAADLDFVDGETIEPRPGDRIIETLNGVEFTYEVMPIGKRPAAEWTDTAGVMRTVHTKLRVKR